MKSHITAVFIFLILASAGYAQPGRDFEAKREKIKALKVAYITDQLQLTPDEAQRFWPVYNEFDDKRHDLEAGLAGDRMGIRPDVDQMSDQDIEKFIQDRLETEQKILDLKKEYYTKFKAVLPVRKVFLLFEAENGFKRFLLERLQEGQRPAQERPDR